jgi:type VI secretion system protein ImpA
MLNKKRETEPDEEPAEPAAEQPADEGGETVSTGGGAAAVMARAPQTADPVDHEDAIRRVAAVAKYLRQEDPCSPAPYLLIRALRWGELRASGATLDPALLLAPSTEVRQNIKRLSLESNWQELLEAAEIAMASPTARAWLDLQRYVVKACEEMGSAYEPIALAVRGALHELLSQYPQLPQMTLIDDTPTANAETQIFLQKLLSARSEAPAHSMEEEGAEPSQPGSPPDALQLATEAAAAGRLEDAINILTGQAAQERSPRARFQRRLQLAQLCIDAGQEEIAYPILQALAADIDEKHLDNWESLDVVAHPLTLLLRCMTKLDGDAVERHKLYARICRLDPAQALKLAH